MPATTTPPPKLAAVAQLARAELIAERVEKPSRAAILDMGRRMLAAGKATSAGLHTLTGIVAVSVLEGPDHGFAHGDWLVDVRGRGLDVARVRSTVSRWLGGGSRRGLVRVREASALDLLVAWVGWRLRARALRRAISELAPVPRS